MNNRSGYRQTLFPRVLLVLVTIFHPVVLSANAAVLVNGSFEEEGEAPDRAKGWSRWGNWINRETGWTPSRHGQCVIAYHHWRIETKESAGIWQEVVGVKPGARVTFSIDATRDEVSDDQESFESIELRVETTLYGEQSTVASQTWPSDAIETHGRWSRLAVRTVAPKDRLRVLVIVNSGPGKKRRGGALKLDEARLDVVEPDGTGGQNSWKRCRSHAYHRRRVAGAKN